MNYLVPLFDCVLLSKESYNLIKNVKYEIECDDLPAVIFSYENVLPFVFVQNKESENYLKVKFNLDNYYFLFPNKLRENKCIKFTYKNNEVIINLSSTLHLSINGKQVLEKVVENLSFDNYEELGELCLIYFTGKRNFLIVLKNKEISFANYYDEFNTRDNEKYFMCRLNDSLNHGKVCHIKDNKLESYLVYLDNEDLNLKHNFVAHVFLDCLLAENYKYCNNLLNDDIKLKDENSVKEFFPEFDYYYPITNEEFILIKKNTLAGIYKFEIQNKLIVNISLLNQ